MLVALLLLALLAPLSGKEGSLWLWRLSASNRSISSSLNSSSCLSHPSCCRHGVRVEAAGGGVGVGWEWGEVLWG